LLQIQNINQLVSISAVVIWSDMLLGGNAVNNWASQACTWRSTGKWSGSSTVHWPATLVPIKFRFQLIPELKYRPIGGVTFQFIEFKIAIGLLFW